MKTIVVDSSSIITLSSSCLIRLMKHLANEEGISFVIPESVYNESVKRPVKIKRFELNAVRIRDAVEEGYLKLARTTPEITREMHRMHDITMRMCTIRGRECRLVDLGEAETLALAKKLGSDTLLIDERTTRTLIEGPDRLAEFLKRRHGVPVQLNKSAISEFRQEFGHIKVFAKKTGSELAGFIEIEMIENLARINALSVQEKHRNMGFAKELLEHALDYIRKAQAEKVVLLVKTTNERAKKLYQQSGFEFIGMHDKPIDGSQVEIWEKDLSQAETDYLN